jgi:hypothetical protein
MLPKVVFAKTEFVKFKSSYNFNQNIGETYSKQPKSIEKSIPTFGFKKSQEKNPRNQKYPYFCQIFVISNQKSIGYGFKNLANLKSSLWILIYCDFHLRLSGIFCGPIRNLLWFDPPLPFDIWSRPRLWRQRSR